ncbi:MAG: hypothetical protein BGO69_16180 [Bacteroidetes bacterium 46-16]|nr:MAG: hypothetical protein BGO69_16180 [Bacteroidetes bacterium 46-16]
MQELIDHLKEKAGITEEQATKAVHAIKDYFSEKIPMLGGMLENLAGNISKEGHNLGDMLGGMLGKKD